MEDRRNEGTDENLDKELQEIKRSYYKRLKEYLDEKLTYHSNNLKLWIMLALVPVGITISVLLYGNNYFDSSIIVENDADLEIHDMADNYEVAEPKHDFATQINQKMMLPEPKSEPVKATTKDDKRLLDETGNMITVDVKAGETLESIAQRDAGNRVFWVYYFDVNRDKLNAPEDLKEGMKLYVPNSEYFGFSAENTGSVQYAKVRAAEIRKAISGE